MKFSHSATAVVLALNLLAVQLAGAADPKQKVYTIGFLWGLPPIAEWIAAFDQGLRELSWISGQNIVVEHRSSDGHDDRLPALAAEFVDRQVAVIVALSAPETRAARQATSTIPIVFVVHGDPLRTGDIQSLAHPGGNVTGLSQLHPTLSTKQLDLLKQIAPGISHVAVLWNAGNPAKLSDWQELEPAAKTLTVALQSVEIRSPADLDRAFAVIHEQRPDALLTLGDPLTVTVREPIAEFALKERLPSMFTHRQFVKAGELISYGANFPALFRRAASYVDKILKGANPADLPVEQATKFELFLNLQTAKELGISVPQSILATAEEVIE
jgi:putative ABC transport system substrate-binding protein